MNVKNNIKRAISFLLHGSPRPIIANVSYLQPNRMLDGKKIIITGGTRGIGFAMAKKFVNEGAEVIITGRNLEKLKQSAELIGCKYLLLDVKDTNTFEDFINKAFDMLGNVNCLVNNAGISLHEKDFLSVQKDQYEEQYNTNLKGPFFLTQEFIKKCQALNQSDLKNILFISSETSMTVDQRPYGLTKASINSLVQGLAYKYVNENYRINAVAPGVTITDMVGKVDDGVLGYEKGRYYLPKEVAEIACFLLSDISNTLTGQILVCNEGKTINARWK